ncbi:hypothetical protein EDEG_03219 [Edhazardia aedis USNM 41457]|uniref:Uncharacterized protein n=1 Tax=Edhazardia aedis (strain USNM 41457) TaxID=1003232 RepID=J9DIA9_EDHAE|nr:hypothetical protein EDEG_03219 [Edhazardia aedis USNM 41457]|eukprot:EJW02360.1 hypothetical protein EDEG_03219 [Edhazardia aedis USNM 41457]
MVDAKKKCGSEQAKSNEGKKIPSETSLNKSFDEIPIKVVSKEELAEYKNQKKLKKKEKNSEKEHEHNQKDVIVHNEAVLCEIDNQVANKRISRGMRRKLKVNAKKRKEVTARTSIIKRNQGRKESKKPLHVSTKKFFKVGKSHKKE